MPTKKKIVKVKYLLVERITRSPGRTTLEVLDTPKNRIKYKDKILGSYTKDVEKY